MRLCIVGGIFRMPPEYQSKHRFTPETVLAAGLREAGLSVETVSHAAFVPSNKFDVVHVHHLGKGAIRMATAGTGAAFVFTPHDGRLLCGDDKSLVRKAALSYVLRKCDAAIALSNVEAQFLSCAIRDRDRVSIIPNGIPADVFFPAITSRKDEGERYRLLYVGSLVQFKGVPLLLEALRSLIRAWDVELSLVYQHNGSESDYRKLAQRLGIGDRVRFLGFLSAEEVADEYRKADATVLPSYAEALPSVVTESLLCGTPVVATNVGGIPEQVGPFGRIVPPGNAEALMKALDELLRDLSNLRSARHVMRKYAMSRFSVESMVRSHHELYNNVTQRRRAHLQKRTSRFVEYTVELALRLRG